MAKSIRIPLAGLAVATLAFVAAAQSSDAQAAQMRDYHIESQPLPAAVNDWADQAGMQVMWSAQMPGAQREAPEVAGRFSAPMALERVLQGSGLTFAFLDEQTVAIRLASAAGQSSSSTGAVGSEVRSPSPSQREGTGEDLKREESRGEDSKQSMRGPDSAATSKGETISEVVVTGTHIRGVENSTVQVIVMDRNYIDSTGVGTVSALVETLPQNFALASQSGVIVPGVSDDGVQGASLNLRGIGEGTTLTLINGRRMALGYSGHAADISALPLSAIERVEILTDGASALYGSDAVGGVVNFILRQDFDGAETRLRSGWAKGVDEYRASQALGKNWGSGNALMSVEYYDRDLLKASERDFVPSASEIGSLFPQDKVLSSLFSARQSLSETVSLFADALYTHRDSFNEGGIAIFDLTTETENPQFTATVGADWNIGKDWEIETSAGFAENELSSFQFNTVPGLDEPFSPYAPPVNRDSRFTIKSAGLKADGSLFSIPGGSVRAAVGLDWRSESFKYTSSYPSGLFPDTGGDFDQTVRSAFAEASIPIVGADNARRGFNRLQLSLAGRLDEYSNFGSSFDPQFGLMWEPVSGIRFRGSYGTSYVAPSLTDYDTRTNLATAFYLPDPGLSDSVSHMMQINGIDTSALGPQESKSLSLGIEMMPSPAPGLVVGLNYYEIKYTGRIASPPSNLLIELADPQSYGSLILRDPTVQQVNEAIAFAEAAGNPLTAYDPSFQPDSNFDPSTVDVIVDLRRRNMAIVDTSGMDASIQYDFRLRGGSMHLGLAGTYIFKLQQQLTASSAPIDSIATIYNPPKFRLRSSVGWSHQGWAANVYVNHSDSYTDNRVPEESVAVSSYTTVDARLSYDFTDEFSQGFLGGFTLSVNAQNVFNRDPPRINVLSNFLDRDMGFDPTNANPMGRLVAIELMKAW